MSVSYLATPDAALSAATLVRTESTEARGIQSCPLCGGSVARVRRRSVDKFMSLFHQVHRYHCYMLRCSWEGNLPVVSVIDSDISI
jgi:hypothetical protein